MSLDKVFSPKSIALIDASEESGSVGNILMNNLTESGYRGNVYPVNLHKPEILGIKAYQSVFKLPEIVDLAAHENIGFSNFVSVGSMIDVDFGDLIDYFGTDPKTKSILMYVEGITNARKFISAARHFTRTKPVIVVKAGRCHHIQGRKARSTESRNTGET